VNWQEDGQVERWLLVIVGKKRYGRNVVRRKSIEGRIHAVVFSDIDLAAGPYGVRLFAYRNGKPVARGAVDGIVDPTVPLVRAPAGLPKARTARSRATDSKKKSSTAARKRTAKQKPTARKERSKAAKRKQTPKREPKSALASTKICRDGPRWKPKRRCPCPRCRAAAKRRVSTAGVRAVMRSAGPPGRPRVTFWRGG
jgi:hypothetical protein